MKILKVLYNKLCLLWYGLFFGMKGVENVISTNQNTDGSGFEVSDDGNGGVFKDILEEKVTQEVKELRYTSYKVANEAKKYRYIGNGKVIKKTESQLTEKHGLIDESDNLPIILIQDNNLICEDVLTILKEVDNKNNKKVFNEYTIKIKRDLFPRFLIENYIKKLVLKQADGNYVLDLYCSKYPSQFNERKDRAFISELKRIKNGAVKNSDILDFNSISFTTVNAWGVEDWFTFTFNDFEFYDIVEFDGNYILRFGCQSSVFMKNILDDIYCESAETKYQNKEARKDVMLDFSMCRKEDKYVISDEINLDALENVKFSVDNNNE